MPTLATIVVVFVVAYFLVGMKFASRETGAWPTSTRRERRIRDEEYFYVTLSWPRVLWDDITAKFGW